MVTELIDMSLSNCTSIECVEDWFDEPEILFGNDNVLVYKEIEGDVEFIDFL